MFLLTTEIPLYAALKPSGNCPTQYRITGTRIPLEIFLSHYIEGDSPEFIVDQLPTLQLADVYTLIGFYLQNKEKVDQYIQQIEEYGEKLKAEMIEKGISVGFDREKLLERRKQMLEISFTKLHVKC